MYVCMYQLRGTVYLKPNPRITICGLHFSTDSRNIDDENSQRKILSIRGFLNDMRYISSRFTYLLTYLQNDTKFHFQLLIGLFVVQRVVHCKHPTCLLTPRRTLQNCATLLHNLVCSIHFLGLRVYSKRVPPALTNAAERTPTAATSTANNGDSPNHIYNFSPKGNLF